MMLTHTNKNIVNIKINIMPTQGEQQRPAGVNKSPMQKPLGKRVMESRNTNVKSSLSIDNCPYKGNAVLNAQNK